MSGDRIVPIECGAYRVTRRGVTLATRLEDGAAVGVADPDAGVAGLLHLSRAWAPGRLAASDADAALARLLAGMRALGGRYALLECKAVVTDAALAHDLRAILRSRGLGGTFRWIGEPAHVRFAHTGRMRLSVNPLPIAV